MEHRLGMGEFSADIAHAAHKSGQPIPEGCEPPTIEANLVFYIEAFDTLKTCRTEVGIPWTAALEYARCYDIPLGHDFDFFWKAIHAMDKAEFKKQKDKAVANDRFEELRKKDEQT